MNYFVIALVEAVVIVILVLLIVFRKIGHPLSEAEVQMKINRKKEREAQREERREQRELALQQKFAKINAQERTIQNMPRPVTFVSLDGDNTYGRTLCVQDGKGVPYTLHCHDHDLQNAPLFYGLYNASIEPCYYSKRGAILLQ